MSSSQNSQPPPNSPFQGVADMPNGQATDARRFSNIYEYTDAGSYDPRNPMPHPSANPQVMMGQPHRVAGAVAHLSNSPVMSSAQIINSMYHTNDALSYETRAGGVNGFGITNISQQPFDSPGYDPTTFGEVYAAQPLAAASSARGNIATVGQMVQQAALYSNPEFIAGVRQDTLEQFNYSLLTGPAVAPNNPASVASAYNSVVRQNPQYQQLQMGNMTADRLKDYQQSGENYLQTAVRLASSEVMQGVGNLGNSIANQYVSLDPEVQQYGTAGIGRVHQAEIAGGILQQAARTELQAEGRSTAAEHVSYNLAVDDVLSDQAFTEGIPQGRETFVTHTGLRDQPIPLTLHEMRNIGEVANAYKGRAKANAIDSETNSFVNSNAGFSFGASMEELETDNGPNNGQPSARAVKQFTLALREATQALKGLTGAGGVGGGGVGGVGGVGGGGAGGGGGGEGGRISTQDAISSLKGAGDVGINARTGLGYSTLGRTGGFISGVFGGQGTEDDSIQRRQFKFLGRTVGGLLRRGLGASGAVGGATVEEQLNSIKGFGRGFEGIGALRGMANMAAGGELPALQAKMLMGGGAGGDMLSTTGIMDGQNYGLSADQMGALLMPLASAQGGGPIDVDKTMQAYAAGEDVSGYYSLQGQRRVAGYGMSAQEFNAAKARNLKGTAATGFASQLFGAASGIDQSMNMGQDLGMLEGRILAMGRGNINRGAGVFNRGAGLFGGAKQMLLSPFQGMSDILLMNEALGATGSITGAANRLEQGQAGGGVDAFSRLRGAVGGNMARLMMRSQGLSARDVNDLQAGTALTESDDPAFDQAGDTSAGATKASSALATRRNEQLKELYDRFGTFEKILDADRRVEKRLLDRLDDNMKDMNKLLGQIDTLTNAIDGLVKTARNTLIWAMNKAPYDWMKVAAFETYDGAVQYLGAR